MLGYPAGFWPIPEKIAAKMTEMKVKRAEKVATFAKVEKVLGSEAKNEIAAVMAENPIVQSPWPVIVFHHLAPTRQCRPIMKVLFRMNMTAVK
jgi:predicted regulator of amino acid metabolism with ACT domain